MNSELQTVQVDDQAVIRHSGDPGHIREHGESPFKRLHLLLQDRYIWACLLGLVLAAGGGYVGWQRVEMVYRSGGTIKIEPRITRILYKIGRLDIPRPGEQLRLFVDHTQAVKYHVRDWCRPVPAYSPRVIAPCRQNRPTHTRQHDSPKPASDRCHAIRTRHRHAPASHAPT